jgi:hypothetical protein
MGVIAAPSNGRGASSRRRRRDGEQSVAVVGRMEDQEEIIMQGRKPPEPDDVHGFSFPPQIKMKNHRILSCVSRVKDSSN